MFEHGWRAWLMSGLASQKLADRANAEVCFKNAGNGFSSLEQKWGTDVFKAYQERPDIQFYRRQLDQLSASLR